MPLPASGPITLSQIRDELAPGNASALSLGYYRGRTYSVSGGGTRTIGSSPKFSDFYNLAAVTLRIDVATYTRTWVNSVGGFVHASIAFGSDGNLYATPNNSDVRTLRYPWISGGTPADYDVRASDEQAGGFSSSSGFNTWLSLDTPRFFEVEADLFTLESKSDCLYEIRNRASGIVMASNRIIIRARGSP